jgi:hypothetical protein
MPSTAVFTQPHTLASMLAWKRLMFTLAIAIPLGLLLSISSSSPTIVVVGRSIMVALIAMLAFGLTERWPLHLPNWLARWVLQLVAVVVAVPLGALVRVLGDARWQSAVRSEPTAAGRVYEPYRTRGHGCAVDCAGRDGSTTAQVHRSIVVNLRAISHVKRGLNETAEIYLKGRNEVLPVSRSYLHLFRQM